MFVGIAFIVLIVIATVEHACDTDEGGMLGTDETDGGEPLPEFAVPELLGSRGRDANVYQDDCETSRNPCPRRSAHPRLRGRAARR